MLIPRKYLPLVVVAFLSKKKEKNKEANNMKEERKV